MLKWWNLKKNKCPKCNKDFTNVKVKVYEAMAILHHPCGFKISEQRFKEIASGQVEQDLDAQRDMLHVE